MRLRMPEFSPGKGASCHKTALHAILCYSAWYVLYWRVVCLLGPLEYEQVVVLFDVAAAVLLLSHRAPFVTNMVHRAQAMG